MFSIFFVLGPCSRPDISDTKKLIEHLKKVTVDPSLCFPIEYGQT